MTTGTEIDRVARRAGLDVDLTTAGRGVADAADRSIVVEWVQRLAVVHRGVELVLDTPLIPAAYWPLPLGVTKLKDFPSPWLRHSSEDEASYNARRRIAGATASATALWGEKYGWTPEVSWRHLYVTNGKVGMQYDGILARLHAAGVGVQWAERSATRAALRLRRPGAVEWSQLYEYTFDDAVAAGLVPKQGPNDRTYSDGNPVKGGNDQYLTRPRVMLAARAISEGARIEVPDVLDGLIVAELADDDALAGDVTESTTVTVTARSSSVDALRAALDAPTAEVPVDPAVVDPPAPPVDPPAGVDPATGELPDPDPDPDGPVQDRTWRAVNARFVELGVTGPGQNGDRWWITRNILQAPLVSHRDELTERQAHAVLRMLQGSTRAGIRALLDRRQPVELDDRERSDLGPADTDETREG